MFRLINYYKGQYIKGNLKSKSTKKSDTARWEKTVLDQILLKYII